MVGTGFEADKRGGTQRGSARLLKGDHFGMGQTRTLVPTLTNDLVVFHQNTADPRIRGGRNHVTCQIEGSLHMDWPVYNCSVQFTVA